MTTLLSMKGIDKSFGPVQVLKDVSFDVKVGEIHALMGENGAGKSTLMNILGGVIPKDRGEVIFDGQSIDHLTPLQAAELGIGFVHQEFNLAEPLSVAENVYMGRLPYINEKLGIVDYKKLYEDTQNILNLIGVKFKPTDLVSSLPTAGKQLVEIAKALSMNAKVIIFDEPTTSLSDKDVEVLFIIIRALKGKGISSIYISHRMEEIKELCDRITILRDGTYISTDAVEDLTDEQIIQKLVGRSLENLYPTRETAIGEYILEVDHLSDQRDFLKDISFKLRRGEVIGFAGLVGSGRTEIMRLLFGADKGYTGSIKLRGQEISISSPVDAIAQGICLLTEDRKQQGVALGLSINENVNMAAETGAILNHKEQRQTTEKFVEALKIKTSNIQNPVSSLSGGNQQKVVLAKWLNTDSEIYIFDEPTKGIDIGAKSEIYAIINNLTKENKGIIVVSSEIPELMGICDRIYVLSEGRLTGELRDKNAFTQEAIMTYATAEVKGI
ncbi:sugar ABC transporter ATP-binding protein [Streptococcus ovuberis]|uniref:Sugar ABC transporter ATP-binding protein n=1 Tax=Streptococcus ovuberis TaxID=1936207 RepID=A0A7X6S0N7_9STRE|nr:sugar ABC transporter ATP-binding protein [Streptococcus ovuberis]NKZ19535.1 sugar ABC transporter ATP-binding protein [Streptococcus ovuberis]